MDTIKRQIANERTATFTRRERAKKENGGPMRQKKEEEEDSIRKKTQPFVKIWGGEGK